MKRLFLFILLPMLPISLVLPCEGLSQGLHMSCSIYPTSLDFGTVRVGLSKDIYFSITNTGGETLSGYVRESCGEYIIVSGSGSYSLGEGQSRIVTVRFTPTSVGGKTCTIETGNSACIDVSCTGTGDTSPSCFVDPTSLDFGRVDEGYWEDRSFTIKNVGGGTLSGIVSESCEEYSIVSGGGSYNLGAGESRTVTVRFAPTSIGMKSCTIETGNSSCHDVSCSGTSGILPSCSVDPESLDFGTVFLGNSMDLNFTITNVGGGTLNGSVSEKCDEYIIVSGEGEYSLGAGETRTVTVQFAPTSIGEKSCVIETGDSLCPDVDCSGTGDIPPFCSLSAESLDFGTVNVEDWEDRSFSITNTGGGMLIGNVSETCEAYSIVSGEGPYSLGAGQSLTVTVRFAPTSMGMKSCVIETGESLCADIYCTGMGEMPPSCSLSAVSLDFGTILIGDAEDRSFTITNMGGRTLNGIVSESCEEYSIVSGEGEYSLGADESWIVTVRFAPASIGSKMCTIETGNSLCSDVSCSGRGDISPSCSLSTVSLGFGMVDIGNWEDRSFTITNTGGGMLSGNVSESCAHFEIVSGEGSYRLGAGESQTVTVRFAPTLIGHISCIIETGNSLCDHVSCYGTGGDIPSCSVYPTSLDFGTVYVGVSTELYFTVTNIGGGTLSGYVRESCEDFSIISGSGSYSLGEGQSRIVTVQFAPTSISSKVCTIETGNDACSDVRCSGTGDILTPCSVYPTSLDFGSVLIGDAEDRSFTITYTGTETLNGTVSESCEEYEIISGGGSYSLGSGESRTVTVRFAPTSMGSKNCIVETGHGYCSDVSCSGIGDTSPSCSVDPTSLDFGTVLIGNTEDRSFTIMNVGGGTLSGSVSETCEEYSIVSGEGEYSLGAGEYRTVTVRFAPVTIGSATCTIETGDSACSDVSCSGTGDASPSCSVDPTSLDFGTVLIGDTEDRSFTIMNVGGGTLSGSVSEICEEYSIVSGEGEYSLGAGQSWTVTVKFAPVTIGSATCTIETGNSACSDVSCSGTGDAPPSCFVDPVNLDFGTVLIGDAEDRSFTLTNTGGGTLSGSVSESCEEYSIVSGEGVYSLGAGQFWTVTVRFAPVSIGSTMCTIETGNSACSDVSCSGTGDAFPSCSVDPASLDFGTVLMGNTEDLSFTITNTGGGVLSGTVSETCEEYSLVSGAGSYSLGAGESRTVTVRFAPASVGSKMCTIETGDDVCADVSCTGFGKEPTAVSQLDVNATYRKGCVSLSWRGERQTDVMEYIIHRSFDNIFFEKIGSRGLTEHGAQFAYLDCDIEKTGLLYYRLIGIGMSGQKEALGATSIEITRTIPEICVDVTNWPNPFNATTEIHYFLTEPSHVTLTIYNTLGHEVEVLVHQYESIGDHSVSWNARGVPSGIYVYQIQVGDAVIAKRMLLLR